MWKTTSLQKHKWRLGERLPLKERALRTCQLKFSRGLPPCGVSMQPGISTSHATHVYESCHTSECVMTPLQMHHVTKERAPRPLITLCAIFFGWYFLFCLRQYAISFDKGMKCAQVEGLFRVLYIYIYINSCCCRVATVGYAIPPHFFLSFFLSFCGGKNPT